MLSVKNPIAPSPYESRTRTRSVSLFICVGLLFVGLNSASAQVLPVELPARVAAPFMSYQGAGWLERPERVAEEMPDAMVAMMGLEDGDVVADIGAGSGFFTRRMARLVAPTGTVYAVDIQPEMLEILQGYVEEEGVTGVVPVLSEFDDPKLPEGEIDWILLVDVYHEFGNHEAMLAKMRQALKPDGRVALLEYRVEDGTGDHIKGDHRMSVRQVMSEWGPAGVRPGRAARVPAESTPVHLPTRSQRRDRRSGWHCWCRAQSGHGGLRYPRGDQRRPYRGNDLGSGTGCGHPCAQEDQARTDGDHTPGGNVLRDSGPSE